MIITKKDKELLLLVVSIIILLWFFVVSTSSIISKISSTSSNIRKVTNQKTEWLNSSRPITESDLKNRIILLDFWTYSCINCLHMLPETKKLEEEFGTRLTVIGVHSGKFENEKQTDNIKKAILKYNIEHLVINDANLEIWSDFKVDAWPTMILISPNGKIIKKYRGEVPGKKIAVDIRKLVKKYQQQLDKSKLPIVLEKNKINNHILKFPAAIKFVKDFSYKNNSKANALIISNTEKNSINITSLSGNTLLEIGSQNAGFKDGEIEESYFKSPRGLLFKDNILYVADTGNHAVRKIDFKTNKVTTIIGSGNRGYKISKESSSENIDLASPWDLEFFPDKNHIAISNAGSHQILLYNIDKKTIKPLAGNGNENLIDGKYPENSLAQTSGLSAYDGKLYFMDSESSSLRVADKNGNVTTLVGKGLFDFGHKNGAFKEALLQHPVGLLADDTGVYITDTQNNIIRKYDYKTKNLSDYSGLKKGSGVGRKNNTSYDGPEAITSFLDNFYIADTNNDRILKLNRKTGDSTLIDIIPRIILPSEGLLEYLPNLETIPTQIIKPKTEFKISFQIKKGWKINESAPSFFNLVEIKNKKEANLIASINSEMIGSGSAKFPKLSKKYTYYLQGTIYYCEDKENALCFVKSYEQKLLPKPSGSNEIKININK